MQAEDTAHAILERFAGIQKRANAATLDCNARRNLELAEGIAANLRRTLRFPNASIERLRSMLADLDWRCDRIEQSIS